MKDRHHMAVELGLKYEREVDPRMRASVHQAKKVAWSELKGWIGKVREVEVEIESEREDLICHNVAYGKFAAEEKISGASKEKARTCIILATAVSRQRLALLREHLERLDKYRESAKQAYVALRDEADRIETEAKRIEYVNRWIDEQVNSHRHKRRRAA